MAGADILDVMDISQGPTSAHPAKKVKLAASGKPEGGMARELYSLIGDNNPPVVTLQSKYKEKPRFKQKAAHWQRTPFRNAARKDNLELEHWTKGVQTEGEQSWSGFASFDRHVDVTTYTDAEYQTYLDRPDWTREETDQLVELCRDWDLRFVVIHDRWLSGSLPPRTLEQLKDRYYGITRALLASRGQSTEGLHYDLQRETTRRQYLEEMFSRTPEEIAEENRLILETRRLEAYEKALAQQKAELLRTLETPQSQGSIAQYQTSQGLGTLSQTLSNADKQKHKKKPSEVASPQVKQRWTRLTPREERERGVTWHEKLTSGCFLRSQKTLVLKPTVAAKVATALQELGLSNVLTMPTERTVRKFDQLQSKIGILLEAKRVCDKMEHSVGTPSAES